MTDDGLLSQDDIDALLSAAPVAAAGKGKAAAAVAAKGGFDPETLRPALRRIVEQCRTVLSTVVNRDVDVEIGTIVSEASGVAGAFPEGGLGLKTSFDSGLVGDMRFLLTRQDAALVADLMMMGDGTAAYNDDHRDALSELGNQIMGTVSTALSSEMEIGVSTGQSEATLFDAKSPPWKAADFAMADLQISIQGFPPASLKLLVARPLAERFAETLGGGRAAGFAQAAPAALGGSDGEADFIHQGASGFAGGPGGASSPRAAPSVEMLLDIPLNITIELGRSNLSIRRILELGPGSIVELDHMASEPVDLLVNDKVVAKGEVVVIDEYFGIRIISLVSPEERIKNLQ